VARSLRISSCTLPAYVGTGTAASHAFWYEPNLAVIIDLDEAPAVATED
jgi:hypothetical protein